MRIDIDSLIAASPRPLDLAQRLNFRIQARAHRDACRIVCPWHNGKHFNCSLWIEDGRVRSFCHVCKQAGDFLGLVAVANGLDPRADFRRVAELAADVAGIALPEEQRTEWTKPQPPRPTVEKVAERIDYWAEKWIDGKTNDESLRERDTDPKWPADRMIDGATRTQIAEALELLSIADEMDREEAFGADAKLDAMAETVLARIAAREFIALETE